ncbi:MAG TPA: L,D-transpeptidase family protein [Xanthobacteraceae bacterium]
MGNLRFDRLLAGAILVVAMAVPIGAAPLDTPEAIENAIPVPEPAELRPITATDFAQDKAIEAAIPVPEPAELKPITTADIAPDKAAAIPVPEPLALKPLTPADLGEPATGSIGTRAAKALAAPQQSVAPRTAKAPAQVRAAARRAGEPAFRPAVARPAAEEPQATGTTPAAPEKAETAAQVAPLVERLKAMLSGRLDRPFTSRKERAAVDGFYAARGYAPLWLANGGASERARAAIAYLASVDAEGLDPADYPIPAFKSGGDPDAVAEAELKLTASVLTFARHSRMGRVHFSRVSADIQYALEAPDPADVLAEVADAKDVAETLAGFNPQQPAYRALKAKLAELRAAKGESGPPPVAGGPALKLGKTPVQDARVPRLRERLGVAGSPDDLTYDRALAEAVAAFQKQHKLKPTGQLTAATIAALNGPRRDRDRDIDAVLANMERWRWMPRELGRTHVVLNIPDFTLRVYREGAAIWHTRVVVGKPSTPTPIFSETMKYITVNPTWNVPPSIVYNEYLPALQQDPTVLDRMGLRLTQNADGSVHISQPPGERNALGRIRFNFPNRFLVYQHDTPDKHLFGQDKRAYSHGCMRVQDPVRYAEILLGIALPKEGYSQERIRSMFGSSERDIRFPTPIQVHITYQTAFVDEAGTLQVRDDLYGRDARLLALLKGEERRVADVPMERPHHSAARPPVRLPPGVGGYSYASGPSFFDVLFGAGRPAPPAPVPQRRVFAR